MERSCRSHSHMTPALALSSLLFIGTPQAPTSLAQFLSAAVSQAAPSSTDDPSRLTADALTRMEQGDNAAARQILNRALSLSPNHPAANNTLGQLLLTQHRYPEAMDRFETVLAINLPDPQAREGAIASFMNAIGTSLGPSYSCLSLLGHSGASCFQGP